MIGSCQITCFKTETCKRSSYDQQLCNDDNEFFPGKQRKHVTVACADLQTSTVSGLLFFSNIAYYVIYAVGMGFKGDISCSFF